MHSVPKALIGPAASTEEANGSVNLMSVILAKLYAHPRPTEFVKGLLGDKVSNRNNTLANTDVARVISILNYKNDDERCGLFMEVYNRDLADIAMLRGWPRRARMASVPLSATVADQALIALRRIASTEWLKTHDKRQNQEVHDLCEILNEQSWDLRFVRDTRRYQAQGAERKTILRRGSAEEKQEKERAGNDIRVRSSVEVGDKNNSSSGITHSRNNSGTSINNRDNTSARNRNNDSNNNSSNSSRSSGNSNMSSPSLVVPAPTNVATSLSNQALSQANMILQQLAQLASVVQGFVTANTQPLTANGRHL